MRAERGTAILTVALLAALAGSLLVALLAGMRSGIHHTQRYHDYMQAWQYALGAENYAAEILLQDATESPTLDHLEEPWAKVTQAFKMPNATLSVNIRDLNHRFNLNALTNVAESQQAWQKLTTVLQLDLDMAQRMLESAALWTNEMNPQAGEDNTTFWLNDPAELLTLGMPEVEYRKLEPFVTALPAQDIMVNANTAPVAVIAAVSNSLGTANALIDARKEAPLTAEALLQFSDNDQYLSSTSRYYAVTVQVENPDGTFRLRSLLFRQTDKQQQYQVKPFARQH